MAARKTSIIYESFYDAISDLEDADFIKMMKAYCEYTLYGTEPQLSGCLLSMWKLIRPVLDKNTQLQDNGSRGGRPRKDAQASAAAEVAGDQPETKPKPNRNQTETKAEPNRKHDDLYMDMDMDMDMEKDKDLDKDISLSAKAAPRGGRERETFLEILFFEKKLLRPQVELERFTNHYAKCGWVDAHGNRIRDRAAALRSWSPDKAAPTVPERTCAVWREVYEAIRAADPGCDATPMLTDFQGLLVEGSTVYITARDAALRDFLEAPEHIQPMLGVLKQQFHSFNSLTYRILKK